MADARPQARKGRGATFNPANRFRRDERVVADDGWASASDDRSDDELPPLKTIVSIQNARTIIARNDSPDARSRSSNVTVSPRPTDSLTRTRAPPWEMSTISAPMFRRIWGVTLGDAR